MLNTLEGFIRHDKDKDVLENYNNWIKENRQKKQDEARKRQEDAEHDKAVTDFVNSTDFNNIHDKYLLIMHDDGSQYPLYNAANNILRDYDNWSQYGQAHFEDDYKKAVRDENVLERRYENPKKDRISDYYDLPGYTDFRDSVYKQNKYADDEYILDKLKDAYYRKGYSDLTEYMNDEQKSEYQYPKNNYDGYYDEEFKEPEDLPFQ